ncbi:MAG: lytic transglycosylase domain-containing protein [Bacteroidetes bacterium]|nr:lytic transglycosylase domain-containing protein [Bacteroidota bacterium]
MLKNTAYKLYFFLVKGRIGGLFLLILLLIVPIEFFIFSSKMTSEDELYWKSFLANNRTYGVMVPRDLQFAEEKVPVYDFTVTESIERELIVNTYFHSQTILMHKRANRWLPFIASILKKNGIPDDFKYIPLIESNLTNSVSPKGAAGFWQFVDGTGKQYELEMNDEIDERYNLEKSTEAACRYFNDAYKIFGNWTLAAASYNMGIDGLKTQMEKQKANSYYDLTLNEETARYIFRILTVKEIISNPKKYGYLLRTKDLYPPISTRKIRIDSSITDLTDFANKNNVSYKILKYFNPWLRKTLLSNKNKKTYFIEFPKQGYNEEYIARLASSDSLGMRIDDIRPSETILSSPADSIFKK